jgi:hypothetical protein
MACLSKNQTEKKGDRQKNYHDVPAAMSAFKTDSIDQGRKKLQSST